MGGGGVVVGAREIICHKNVQKVLSEPKFGPPNQEFLDQPLLNVGLLKQFKGLYFLNYLQVVVSYNVPSKHFFSIKACSLPILSPYLHSFLSNHFQEECHEYCNSGTDTSSHHHEQ